MGVGALKESGMMLDRLGAGGRGCIESKGGKNLSLSLGSAAQETKSNQGGLKE